MTTVRNISENTSKEITLIIEKQGKFVRKNWLCDVSKFMSEFVRKENKLLKSSLHEYAEYTLVYFLQFCTITVMNLCHL